MRPPTRSDRRPSSGSPQGLVDVPAAAPPSPSSAAIFREIADTYSPNYYALQARNRLLDIEQRTSVAGQLVADAQGIANSADEVLDALDEAEASAEQFAYPQRDPRAAQRHALWGTNSIGSSMAAGAICLPGSSLGIGYCKVEVPRGPVRATLAQRWSQAASAAMRTLGSDASDAVIENDDDEATLIAAQPSGEANIPAREVDFADEVPRVEYSTQARIYWNGRLGSATAFARARVTGLDRPV